MHVAIQVAAAGRTGADRAIAVPREDGHLLVLADGATGIGGGAAAADAVIAAASECGTDLVEFLESLDHQLNGIGETTAVVVHVANGLIRGATVGDSEAWLVDSGITELSEKTKARLGSGRAEPSAFGPVPCTGRVLLASDGLLKFVDHDRICRLARAGSIEEAATALVAVARLRSGALQDDVAVVLAG
jgi:serine/threonine protein phosphatase PrpC